MPWYLTTPQARFLTVALEQAKDVALRIRDDKELPLGGPEGTMLVRALRVTKSGAKWKDEYTYHLEPVQDQPSQRPYFPRALT